MEITESAQVYLQHHNIENIKGSWKDETSDITPMNSINTGTITPDKSFMFGWSPNAGNNYECRKQF